MHYLERFGEVQPAHGPVLVTGAAGGLGQLAIALLAARGFDVIASTGRRETLGDHLRALGASQVIDRLDAERKPLGTQRWAGVVDSVGGATLAAALAQTMYRGAVASPGVAGGGELQTSVYPFILRGVRLLGVDQTLPYALDGYPNEPERQAEWRHEARRMWELLAESIRPGVLERVAAGTIRLDQVADHAPRIIDGQVAGRLLVDMRA